MGLKEITNPLIRKNGHTDSINSLSGIQRQDIDTYCGISPHLSYKACARARVPASCGSPTCYTQEYTTNLVNNTHTRFEYIPIHSSAQHTPRENASRTNTTGFKRVQFMHMNITRDTFHMPVSHICHVCVTNHTRYV